MGSRPETRVFNFSAGPAVLPEEVLAQAAAEMLDWHGSGMSVMEMSHRGKEFIAIAEQAEKDFRELLKIPQNYKVLFLQGGATLQFGMVPMNLLGGKKAADYIYTGEWSKKAIKEANRFCEINIAASSEGKNFTSLDVSKFGLIYAGAQKNIGPAGLTIVIVREDLLGHAMEGTPSMLDYKVHADSGSMSNTPATYAWYIAGLVFQWLKAQGGLAEIEKKNIAKAKLLYDFLDASKFFKNPVRKSDRSRMNIPFTLADAKLDAEFLKGAEALGMVQLKGHRAVGGMRASIYNAMPIEGVKRLVEYMREFEANRG